MHKNNGKIFYSPSDLTRYMDSPFSLWMDRLSIEQPEKLDHKDEADALKTLLSHKGYAHEDKLKGKFIKEGLSLVNIDGESTNEKKNKTLQAMTDGIDIIAQARLEFDQFSGYADFLRKVTNPNDLYPSSLGDYHYEICDAKLANEIKPTFVIQLCCYTEMLEAVQGYRPEFITVLLGNGVNERLKLCEYYYYYQNLKELFLSEQKSFNSVEMPDPYDSGSDSKNWGDWSDFANNLLKKRDHLFQVARITRGQIKKLNQAGITTMKQLADSTLDRVSGINSQALEKLKDQAAIQKKSEGCEKPQYKIIIPSPGEKPGLELLPPHCSLDVFFDIEGYPLEEGGLEYLWGSVYFNDTGHREYIDFWAHNRYQEKLAFESFIGWVYDRWKKEPKMHIYHYASYEIDKCRKLMGRYGICEHEVDQLLRNEVFIDLYKIVKGGLILGESRYSIKNVEHLYRGKRDTEVGNGGQSVVVYENWRERNQLGEQGDTWQTSKILNDIRKYNIDDCESTQELVIWLREQQKSHDISFNGKEEVTEPEIKEESVELIQLQDRLILRCSKERKTNETQAQLTENLAWILDFHRRENKPVFWNLFERLEKTHDELMDDLECLAYCRRTERDPFKPKPRSINLAYEYRFDPTQEFKGAKKSFYLLGITSKDGKNVKVIFVEEESDLESGIIVIQSKDEPPVDISLIPDAYVPTKLLTQAIYKSVSEYENGSLKSRRPAIFDFLVRAKPRIMGHNGGPIISSHAPLEPLEQIIDVVRRMDNSYLTIQGPPGAGKSYTGQHVIADLVKNGARVGITSNSHKAINSLLLKTAKYCKEKKISATFHCTKDNEPEFADYDVTILKNKDIAQHIHAGCVIGTTAWGFAREDMEDQLDYLFVDEAGQVSVANLIAMSRSTKNIILMGDQMQLGQPLQGTHPGESGLSVLDYLLSETPTISAEMGVFLETSYRMHSLVNQFISEHIYEGKLRSNPMNDRRVIEVPSDYDGPLDLEAGLLFIPVQHEGNVQASTEEVFEIKKMAQSLIGRKFHGDKDELRLIGWSDILVVAPYNHQVRKLKEALGDQVEVGTVDKFQGQEAPIVFLSMCSSDANESHRGLDFLFDKHRINVAISRAQSLVIVVGNPNLGKTSVNQVSQMKLVNLFNAITRYKSRDSRLKPCVVKKIEVC